MIVTLSGGDELGISGDIAVRPCLVGAIPAIGRSAAAKDIVESDGRRFLYEGAAVKTGLPGFCDYYVIGENADANKRVDTSAGNGLIAGDEILDDQSLHLIHHVDAASLTLTASVTWLGDTISLNDISFDDRGSIHIHEDASSIRIHVVGDYIVEDLWRTNPYDADSPS